MQPKQISSVSSHAGGQRWQRLLSPLLLVASTALPLAACSRPEPKSAPEASIGAREQAIVERAASAFERTRQDQRFSSMDFYLQRAHGVMIFPRLVKASLIVGGEGGNGVLVARRPDGSWSNPAFYSLGAPSVGLQIGYQEATVVLFIMDQPTLERVMASSFTLGTKTGATLGDVGERGGAEGELISRNIYQVIDAGGVFAGVSLDGYVTSARSRHNLEYYGAQVSPRDILLGNTVHKPEASVLSRALAPRAPATQPLADKSR